MSMRINTNIEAMDAQRNLGITAGSFAKSVEKLSSGLRINRAADDAAGLAISEKLRGQVNGLNQAVRNAQDGISLIQTAEGALNETHSILQRMRELAVQGANDTLTSGDRSEIKTEMDQLSAEIDRVQGTTQFNTQNLLDGTYTGKLFQIGANSGQTLTVGISDMGATALTVTSAAVDVSTAAAAATAMTNVDGAIKLVSDERSKLGAIQNRLEHTISNLSVASENLATSESRIRDVDLASEMVNFTRSQILQQAGTAILAQANQAPQSVLQLLR